MSSGPVQEIASPKIHDVAIELLQQEARSGRVLDMPCGHGALSRRLVELGYDVVAADGEAGVEVPGATVHQIDMNERLPFADGEFDLAICLEGIEHVERTYDLVAELHRVIKPGGTLILSTPNISSLRSRWRWFWTGFHHQCKAPLDEVNPDPLHHINMLGFPKIRYMLHRQGFELDKLRTNRCKGISYCYAPLIPFTWLMTKQSLSQELDDPAVKAIAADTMRQMYTRPVLFGDSIIVTATRKPGR